ncbi:MAG: multi-sensor hybrid histidine kinase [Bacteroidetes bacterium]|nr:multi-sensor hybrid histidine kinase [Bacteroidota bacterium]
MKNIFRLPQIIKDTEVEFRKSILLIYSVLFLIAVTLLTLLFYFLYEKNNKVDILTYASRQRMYSQKIALDVTIHSETNPTGTTTLIISDLQKMKDNSNKTKKYLQRTQQYSLYEPIFRQTDAYFRSIENYIETRTSECASQIRQQTFELYPNLELLVNLVIDETKRSDRNTICVMLLFVLMSALIFLSMTLYKIIPYIRKYNQNHKDIIDSQYKLKVATEAASLGIFKHDVESNRLEWDSQMYRIYEMDDTSQPMSYEKWYSLLLEESTQEATDQLNRSLKSGDSFHYEFKIKTPKGNVKCISTAGVAIKNKNGRTEVVGVNSDVTNLRNIESELMKSRESAMRANEAKSEFLANMSHEIRTPLNGIIGLSNMVAQTSLSPQQRDYIGRIISSSQLLLQIVNDILDFSKIEAKQLFLVKEDFDLDSIFNKLSNMFGYAAYAQKIDLLFFIDPEIPQKLIGDELRLTQIFVNLVGNALKFTEKGHIRVYAQCLEMTGGDVRLEFKVVDTGIGMSQEKQSKLFTEFEQGDNTTSKRYGGTGLGLVISKKLINSMGGDIDFLSTEGQGSVFRCHLPFKIANVATSPIHHERLAEPEKASILIMTQGGELVEYLVLLLRRDKYHVDMVNPNLFQLHLADMKQAQRIIFDWKAYVTGMLFFDYIVKDEKLWEKTVLLISEYAKTELEPLLHQISSADINFIPVPFTPNGVYSVISSLKSPSIYIAQNKQLMLMETKSCLLVEDNETNRIIAADLLRKIGFEVDLAENGFVAVNKTMINKYDIIFMDIHMPVMDGYEAARKIREIDLQIPIVGLTASVFEKDKEDSSSAGFNHHLGKPIDTRELWEVVSNYFEMKYIGRTKKKEDHGLLLKPRKNAYLNMEYLNEIFPDRDSIESLLNSFLEIYSAIEIDWNATDVDSEDASIKVHTLKGVAGNLHIDSIYEEAEKFENYRETALRQKTFGDLIRQVVLLNKEIEKELAD